MEVITFIFGMILTGIITVGLVLFIINIRKKTLLPSDDEGEYYNMYFLNFKHVEVPDIRQNTTIMEVVKIKLETSSGFTVASAINDVKLRELVMKEYQLTPEQVIVTSRQVFWPVFL